MTDSSSLYWYQFDVLPMVGFVRAADLEQARLSALDDATLRVRLYLEESPLRLDPVDTGLEALRDATTHS